MSEDSALPAGLQQELLQLYVKLNLDESTRSTAEMLLKKSSLSNSPTLNARCAVLVASMMQEVKTLTGEVVRGVGISPMQIISGGGDYEMGEFILALVSFIEKNNIPADVKTELLDFSKTFKFSLKVFSKYEDISDRFQFYLDEPKLTKEKKVHYIKLLKEYSWLLFAAAKRNFLHNNTEPPDNIYLLATLFHFILVQSPERLMSGQFDKNKINKYESEGSLSNEALNQLFDLLDIKNLEKFDDMQERFSEFIHKLADEKVIDPYSLLPENLGTALKHLDKHYQKMLKIEELDMRLFIKDRKKHLTPSKYTPFTKQGAANKYFKDLKNKTTALKENSGGHQTIPKKSMNSQRILNYEVPPKIKINQNFKEIKFSGMVQSPYTFKTMAKTTPMTAAMEMYNWLCSKLSSKESGNVVDVANLQSETKSNIFECYNIQSPDNDYHIDTLADVISKNEKYGEGSSKITEDRKIEIKKLYKKVLGLIISHSEKNGRSTDSLVDEKLQKGLYICCAETYYFIMNLSLIPFEALIEISNVEPLHVWRVLYTFLRFDHGMPSPLKKHFLDLEIHILSSLAWRDPVTFKSFISNIDDDKENIGEDPSKDTGVMLSEYKFFSRVLHHAATQMYHLASSLSLSERILEEIWTCIKFVLTDKIHLLIGRHMDQIIFCSIYVICKIFKHGIKFQDIINKFNELPLANKSRLTDILYSVVIDDDTTGDIIMFYNKIYITDMKSYFNDFPRRSQSISKDEVVRTRTKKFVAPKHKKQSSINILQSPLKELVSSPFVGNPGRPKRYAQTNRSPDEQFKYPLHARPMPNMHPRKDAINSKKVIDFDKMSFESEASKHSKKPKKIHQAEDDDYIAQKFAMMKMSKSNIPLINDSLGTGKGFK